MIFKVVIYMKNYLETFFSSAYISMAIVLSIIFGFTINWQWHSFNLIYSLKLFLIINVIALVSSIPSLIITFMNSKNKNR